MRKAVVILLMVASIFLMPIGSLAAEKVPITVWFYASGSQPVAEWAKTYEARFNAEHPGIDLRFEITTDFSEKVLVAAAAGVGPDIAYISANLVPDWIGRGMTLPLDRYISQYQDFKDFVPDLFQAVKDGKGQIHAMPFAMWSIFDLYNMDTLAESGVQPPQSWDTMITAARKMTVFNPDQTIARYGYAVTQNNMMAIYNIHMAMEQLGKGMLYMGDKRASLNNRLGVTAANYLRDLWQAGMPDNAASVASVGNSASGKVAISGYGTYTLMSLAADAVGSLEPRRVVGPKPGQDIVRFNCGSLYILSTSKHPDQAWQVLTDFLRPEINREYIAAQVSYLPARKSLLSQMNKIVTHPLALKMAQIMYSPMLTYGVVHNYWTSIRTQGGDILLPALQRKSGIEGALENAERLMNATLAEKLP